MATELESIIARLKANTANMRRGFEEMARKARDTTKKIADSFDRLGQRVQDIGRKLSLAITTPLVGLAGFSVKAASDVQELMNLLSVTFAESMDDVNAWADETARAVNRSKFALLAAAGDFAAFLKPMGIAPERIVPMSKALSQLTTDIASFRNIADEEAMTRLFSGMAGEAEAVRRLGIDLSQASIEMELVRLGFKGNAAEATLAQKAMARYNLMIEQTRDSQGDAARTSQSFENQLKGLRAIFRDIRIAIGNLLLPVATQLVNTLSMMGRAFLALPVDAQKTILIFGGIAAAIGPALIVLGLFIRLIGFALGGIVQFATIGVKSIGFLLKGFKMLAVGVFNAMRVVATSMFTLPGIVAAAVAAAVAALLLFPATLREIFSMQALSAILDTFRVAFQNKVIAPTMVMLNDLITGINRIPGIELDLIKLAPRAKLQEDTREFASNLAGVFQEELGRVKGQLKSAIDSVSSTFSGLLPDSLKSALDDIKNIDFDMSEVLNIDGATTDMDAFMAKLSELFTGFDDLGENMEEVGLNAQDLADDLREAFIGRLADVNSLGDAMTAVFDRLKAQLLEIAFFGTTGEGGLFGGTFAKIASSFAGFFGGARANGGPVQSNKAFLVGEKGPEMFVPNSSGNVINAKDTAAAGRRSGEITIIQHINLPPDNAEITERMVTIGAVMRDQAIAAVREARNTGF